MRRAFLPVSAAVLGAALIALLAYGLTTRSASRSLDEAVAEAYAGHGRLPAAPVKPLPRLTGAGQSSLAAYRGHVVVLNFWASWCAPCQSEAPLLEHTERQLSQHGGTVLGVTYDDATPDSQGFVRHYRLTYPELRDIQGNYAHSFGTDQLPESFVIDRSGRVAAISRGEVNQAWLTRAVSLAQRS